MRIRRQQERRRSTPWRAAARAAVAAVCFLAVAGGCGGGDGEPAGPVREVRLKGTEMIFEPATLQLAPGRYRFVLDNVGQVGHELAVSELGGDGRFLGRTYADAGESAALEVALEEGRYELSCHEPGHYEAGMKGTVEVG